MTWQLLEKKSSTITAKLSGAWVHSQILWFVFLFCEEKGKQTNQHYFDIPEIIISAQNKTDPKEKLSKVCIIVELGSLQGRGKWEST